MSKSIHRIFVLAKRNFKEIIRDPLSLIFMGLMPLVLLVLFYYLFHSLTPQFNIQYLVPAIVSFSQSFLSLFIGILIANDRATSFLTRLYVTETKSYEFIFGYILSLIPIIFIQSTLFFVIGGIINSSFWSVNIIYGILGSMITSFLFIGFGILFGSICNIKSIGGISSIIICGQSILSGMWFPLEGIPQEIIVAMNVLPFRNASTFIQSIVNGSNNLFDDVILPLIIILIYTAIIYLLAIFIFKKKMKSQ